MNRKERDVSITFLRMSKEGEYAHNEESSLPYAQLEEVTIETDEGEYYYGWR